jgi:hypothetical protein
MKGKGRVQERTFGLFEGLEFGFAILAMVAILSRVDRQIGSLREETSMGKDAQNRFVLTDEARKKFEDCVDAMAACGFGPEGPPMDTTFAEIEEYGHEVGKMVARALDEKLTRQHATHFQGTVACPCCETTCSVADDPNARDIQTTDGDVPLCEPMCHCPVCNRDFFPSAYRIED